MKSNESKALGALSAPLRAMALVSTSVTAMALFAAPALAQNSTTQPQAADTEDDGPAIVVTGSILRQVDKESASPITTLTTEDLDKRGINTGQDAILKLSSNNGPALTNSFTANGAFAGGAAAVSLRGLSTNSTLVLFDGMRAAYYPLADDGSRNFVDLNTIPDDIIERIDTLKDGASSTYGADAIAGVVNIITKRQFKGISARVEAGVAQRGIAGSQRISVTAGTGDLEENGYNFYVSGFYYNSESVRDSDLKAPFNSSDQRGIGGPNGQAYGLDENGLLANNGVLTAQADGNFNLGNMYVRPADATTNVAITGSRYQLLSSQCLTGTPYTPTTADRAQSNNANVPSLVCREDGINQWGITAPHIERFGGSARFTGKLGDATEAYLEVNLQQTTSEFTGGPSTIRGNAPTGIFFPRFSTSSAALPNYPGSFVLSLAPYVCPISTVGACNATNGTLNPNNPFAAAGQNALLIGAIPNRLTYRATRSRVYRAAAGLSGQIFGDLDYKVDLTAMHTDLKQTFGGYVYIQHLLDVVKDGSFNFVNPSLNSQERFDYLMPTRINNASSDLYQAQVTFGKTLAELPGGPLQLGFGGSLFYEAVDAPSSNSDINGPTQRYFVLNAFGTAGHRTVSALFAELRAPVIDMITVTAAGRYDHYSSGQSNFSPKVGVEFTPLRILKLRGTWSRGFRIPSFGEANALPTTGYVSNTASLFNNTYLAQYGCTTATFSSCPAYIRSGSYGQTTLASPNLAPEKSRSFTLGAVFEPIRNVSFTVDYYNIKKTGAITSASNAPALAAYYTNQPIPAGYTVIPDAPDPNFPNAKPKVAFVQSTLINANTIEAEGIDFGARASHNFGAFKVTSDLSASVLLNLSTEFPDGTVEKYVGTLGNFNLTAGSGTFRWHGYWSNTVETGPVAVTGTVNYTSGYDLSAMDQHTDYKDCGLSPGYTPCHVRSYITFDLNTNVKVNDNFSLYVNVLNAFNTMPAIDPVTYGAFLYNPVQAGEGIYGRMFRAGAKVKF